MDKICSDLYSEFSGSNTWELFPDLLPTLEGLRRKGIILGVISNFDSRLSKS